MNRRSTVTKLLSEHKTTRLRSKATQEFAKILHYLPNSLVEVNCRPVTSLHIQRRFDRDTTDHDSHYTMCNRHYNMPTTIYARPCQDERGLG